VTSTIQVAAQTATAAADGLDVGDVAVYLPAKAADSLKDAVFSAVKSCGAVPAKRGLRRRQSAPTECLIRAAHDASQNDAVWGGIAESHFDIDLPVVAATEASLSESLSAIVGLGWAALSRARRAR
jgi:hypothetical protein